MSVCVLKVPWYLWFDQTVKTAVQPTVGLEYVVDPIESARNLERAMLLKSKSVRIRGSRAVFYIELTLLALVSRAGGRGAMDGSRQEKTVALGYTNSTL